MKRVYNGHEKDTPAMRSLFNLIKTYPGMKLKMGVDCNYRGISFFLLSSCVPKLISALILRKEWSKEKIRGNRQRNIKAEKKSPDETFLMHNF